MTFEVEFSEQGKSDLDEIIRYISEELLSPQAAQKFYSAVNEKLVLLQSFPYLYPLYHDDRLVDEDFHFVTIGNYLMFYIVDDDKAIVSIARILYGRRNILNVIEESL